VTRVACVIGWPVDRSRSPAIHNAAFEALGLDWRYERLPVPPEEGATIPDRLRAMGAEGASVTMPHKESVIPILDAIDDVARRIGAVNTIVARDGGFAGHNTDADGFRRAAGDAGIALAGRDVLVLGAGGAARAVVAALAGARARAVVSARRPDRSAALAERFGATALPWEAQGAWDVLVNATPAGDESVLWAFAGRPAVLDLVYGRPTRLLEAARAAGVQATDGLGMLVHQAAIAFELWTGVRAPLAVMRAAAAG